MNITLILPFLLFAVTIIINLIVINFKLNTNNQNNKTQKRILDKVRKAEQNLNENIVLIEEKISSQKIEVSNIGSSIDRKIHELSSHNQELAKLTNTLKEYRSMLAVLEVSTNQTHEWVVTVRNDCKKLEELQKVIEEHQKSTLEIISSYETAVAKQNKFYGEYENKLEILKKTYISEVDDSIKLAKENLNSKIISMNQVSKKTIEEILEGRKIFENLSNQQIDFTKESENVLQKYIEERDINLNKINEDLDNIVESKLSAHNSNVKKANEENFSDYSEKLNNLNSKKIEEAENALDILVTSINQLDNKKTDKKKVEAKKENKITNEKSKNKVIDKEISFDKELNNTENIEKKAKKYEPIGEEEEIDLD